MVPARRYSHKGRDLLRNTLYFVSINQSINQLINGASMNLPSFVLLTAALRYRRTNINVNMYMYKVERPAGCHALSAVEPSS